MSKKNPNDVTIDDWLYQTEIIFAKFQKAADSSEKSIAQRELLELFTKIEQEFPTDPTVCKIYYNHASVLSETEENPGSGKALSQFTKLFNLEAANLNRDSYDEQYWAIAAQYIGMYHFYNKEYESAMKYALYMMDSDLTYNIGDQIFNVCAKGKPKTAARMRAEHRPI